MRGTPQKSSGVERQSSDGSDTTQDRCPDQPHCVVPTAHQSFMFLQRWSLSEIAHLRQRLHAPEFADVRTRTPFMSREAWPHEVSRGCLSAGDCQDSWADSRHFVCCPRRLARCQRLDAHCPHFDAHSLHSGEHEKYLHEHCPPCSCTELRRPETQRAHHLTCERNARGAAPPPSSPTVHQSLPVAPRAKRYSLVPTWSPQ
mmetsp:Transcript_37664/g.100198  ORF Transcript_37664/g.100198 Transcript_37664/m.100198 type:complete len:201 (-) Transcript_37664:1783-2385(-)